MQTGWKNNKGKKIKKTRRLTSWGTVSMMSSDASYPIEERWDVEERHEKTVDETGFSGVFKTFSEDDFESK
jgi:hypothetical protein